MHVLHSVSLSLILFSITPAFSADNSRYQEGILTIPSVDTADQVGQYQDVTFKLLPDGTWALIDFLEKDIPNYHNPEKSTLSLASLNNIKVITTTSFPVQVFLKAFGTYGGCERLGPIQQSFTNNNFDVAINIILPDTRAISCILLLKQFTEIIPLPVYGLAAGNYNFNVNGLTGSFTLTTENKLTDACTGSSLIPCQ